MNYLQRCRVADLATVGADGAPHLVPLCYAFTRDASFITITNGEERTHRSLKRVCNVEENPQVAVVVDHHREEWERLAYVLVHRQAEVLRGGGQEHQEDAPLLMDRYAQIAEWPLIEWSVLAIRVERV